VDIPDAVRYDADEMYNMLLKEEQENQSQQESQKQPEGEGETQENQEKKDVGHDRHDLWDKAIEESKQQDSKENSDSQGGEQNEFTQKGEQEIFKQNKEERTRKLQDLSKELAQQSTRTARRWNTNRGKKVIRHRYSDAID